MLFFCVSFFLFFFFFNDTATTEIYTLSLHDALPIFLALSRFATALRLPMDHPSAFRVIAEGEEDRKSTRLNSSHITISYAVFCLKKKKTTINKKTKKKTKKKQKKKK